MGASHSSAFTLSTTYPCPLHAPSEMRPHHWTLRCLRQALPSTCHTCPKGLACDFNQVRVETIDLDPNNKK